MNKFISTVGTGTGTSPTGQACQAREMPTNYDDGNTVTARLELRPALRDERQLLRDHVRPIEPRR